MRGIREDAVRRSELDDPPRIHHRDTIGVFFDQAEIVRDQKKRQVPILFEMSEELENVRLKRRVERRRRFVGDEELGVACDRHRDEHALFHPAAELVRVVGNAPLGLGDLHFAKKLDGSIARVFSGQAEVCPEWLHQLRADRPYGIQRGAGFLKNECYLFAADAAERFGRHFQEVTFLPQDTAAFEARRARRKKRMMEKASMDLPEPDSPTTARVSPALKLIETSLTGRIVPVSVASDIVKP